MVRFAATEGDSRMNLSTSNLSLSSARAPAVSNAAKTAAGTAPAAASAGGFEEVFAGLTRAGTCPQRAAEDTGVETNTSDSPDDAAAEVDVSSQTTNDTGTTLNKKKGDELGSAMPGMVVPLLDPMPPVFARLDTESRNAPEVVSDSLASPDGVPVDGRLGTPTFLTKELTTETAAPFTPVVGNEKPPKPLPAQSVAADSRPAPSKPADLLETATTKLPQVDTSREAVSEPKVAEAVPSLPMALPGANLDRPQANATPTADIPSSTPNETKLAANLEVMISQMPVARFRRAVEESKQPIAADFAESAPGGLEPVASGKNGGLKNFLSPAEKAVANVGSVLGTNVAKPAADMPALLSTPISENVFSKDTLPARVDAALSSDFSVSNPPVAGAPMLSGAQHAIEAVLEAGERFTTEAQHAVKMEFSVSGEDLSVHVQMHAGEIRTTFHTASAELRSALAHEWQVLAADVSDRAHRFADPVFSAGSTATTAQGNGGESQGNHRGQEMNQARERFEFSPRLGAGASSHGTDLPLTLPTAVPLTALRLHTFA